MQLQILIRAICKHIFLKPGNHQGSYMLVFLSTALCNSKNNFGKTVSIRKQYIYVATSNVGLKKEGLCLNKLIPVLQSLAGI